MLGSLKKILDAAKEGVLEAGAKTYINQKIQNFGTVTHLQIDSNRRSISIEAELKGEPSAIQVQIGNYELSSVGEKSFITLHAFQASREWVAAVLNEHVAGRPLSIPGGLRSVL